MYCGMFCIGFFAAFNFTAVIPGVIEEMELKAKKEQKQKVNNILLAANRFQTNQVLYSMSLMHWAGQPLQLSVKLFTMQSDSKLQQIIWLLQHF